jgi:threonyl-tRNA synthetase
MVLPIAERHEAYAKGLDVKCRESGLRSSVDLSREKVGKKIRQAEVEKIPLILVVGDKEVERGSASLRVHGQGDKGEVDVARFLEQALALNRQKSLIVNF